jgi:hypothetical protein
MAWSFSVNNLYPLAAESWHQAVIFNLKAQLKAAGWTVITSSTGLGGSYSPANGDVILAATNLNASAWFRIQAPAVSGQTREILVFHNGTGQRYDVDYSAAAGFSGGAPGDTTAPTATDQQRFTSNTASNEWIANANTFAVDYVIGGASENYSFGCFQRLLGSGGLAGGIGLDVLTECSQYDADQAIVWRGTRTSQDWWSTTSATSWWQGALATATGTTASAAFGWYRKGLSSSAFVNYGGLMSMSPYSTGYTQALPAISVGAFNGSRQTLEMLYGRTAALTTPGPKGKSSMFRMVYGGLELSEVLPGSGSYDWRSCGLVLYPWPQNTKPLF